MYVLFTRFIQSKFSVTARPNQGQTQWRLCMCFYIVSFGVKNAWATPISVSLWYLIQNVWQASSHLSHASPPLVLGGWGLVLGGVLPNMGCIGMCGPKGYGFSVVLVINRVWNLANSGHKYWYSFCTLTSLNMGIFLRRSHFFLIIKKKINKYVQKPFTNYVYGNLKLVWTTELIKMQVWNWILMWGSVINWVSNFWSGHK